MDKTKDHLLTTFLFLMALASHLPFLWAGYGREEDAWGQALTAKIMWETKAYEVSRLPGHPLYELLLAGLWPINHSYFFFNLLSALATALAVVLFYRIVKKMSLLQPFTLAVAFWFVPVFFIAGNYTIDYNFALCLILGAFLALLQRRFVLAGILLGLATGFRISSLGFLLPFTIIFGSLASGSKDLLRLWFWALVVALVSFLPPMITYGSEFLDFHKPPFPGIASILYKMSFGIWGVIMFIALLIFAFRQLSKRKRHLIERSYEIAINHLWIGTLIIIILQLIVFLRLPFKAEFFIPVIPFIILLAGIYFTRLQVRLLAGIAVLSTFLAGFDYADQYRGSTPSTLAMHFEAGGKDLFFDPIQGPAILDHQKRFNKSKLVDEVVAEIDRQSQPAWLIAGWYWPELMLKTKEPSQVISDYYSTAAELKQAHANGRQVFFLPEINRSNAQVKGHYLADSLGQPFLSR